MSPPHASGLDPLRLGWPVSNAWILPDTPLGPVLIDCGFGPLWPAIRAGLWRAGLAPQGLAATILTHRHSDHAGNARLLQREHGVPVYAHPRDAEVLAGRTPRPRLGDTSLLGEAMCVVENRFPAPPCTPLPLEDGVAGLEVIPAPGHTAGSILLFHRASGTLFTGDALLNAEPPLTVRAGLTLPYPAFCEDYEQALASLRALLARRLPVRAICAGHGPVWRGNLEEELARLLAAPAPPRVTPPWPWAKMEAWSKTRDGSRSSRS